MRRAVARRPDRAALALLLLALAALLAADPLPLLTTI
jgi:hypothetical protein